MDEKTTQNLYRFLCLACFLSILSQYSYIILFFSSLAEQQIIATIIAVIMESTSQHELSLCSGFFNAQYYIEVRSSSDWAYTYYVHTKGTHIALSADGYVKPFSFLPLALLQQLRKSGSLWGISLWVIFLWGICLWGIFLKEISFEGISLEGISLKEIPHKAFLSKGFLLKGFLSKDFSQRDISSRDFSLKDSYQRDSSLAKGFFLRGFLSKGFRLKGFYLKGFLLKGFLS